MVDYNYFVGIGGTGARLLESIVRLCECGYIGAEKIECLMIDSDTRNGNITRTRDLVHSYKDCRDILKDPGIALFKTEIQGFTSNNGIFKDTLNTGPFRSQIKIGDREIKIETIEKIAELGGPEAINRMKAIFGESEYRNLNLHDGFYGNPAIGSLIFSLVQIRSEVISELITTIIAKLQDNNTEKVKVCMAASLFGGTGAAGLPTLAEELYTEATKEGVAAKLEIFGCAMAPYFETLNKPKDAKIEPKYFDLKAKQMLAEFERLEKAKVFKHLYLIGDPDMIIRGMHAEAAGGQRNAPHIVELFAAAQMGAFFNGGAIITGRASTAAYSDPVGLPDPATGIQDIKWEHCETGEANELQTHIENFILFNYYYSMYVMPCMFDLNSTNNFTIWDSLEKRNKARQRSVPKWLLGGDDGFGKKAMHGMTSYIKWNTGLISVSDFQKLYIYLTESTEWYYSLVHKYEAGVKKCSVCTNSCNYNNLDDCIQTPLLLNLFEGKEHGTPMLKRRSNLPGWLVKTNNYDKFQEKAFMTPEDIDKNTLLDTNINKRSNIEKIRLITSTADSGLKQSVLFKQLVKELYNAIV